MTRKCLYEILKVNKNADENEIKKAYYKLALIYHPDKHGNNDELTVVFKEIQNAYEILSDKHERHWYDDHREEILCENSEIDNELNLYLYFSSTIYKSYDDDKYGFYTIYRNLFNKIEELEKFSRDSNTTDTPEFGYSNSSYEYIISFYNYWSGFISARTFAFVEQYKIKDADNRNMRRLMIKENTKSKQKAKRKYTQQVRELVDFVKKRDRRLQKYLKIEAIEKEKEEIKRKSRLEMYEKEKAEMLKKRIEQYEEFEKENIHVGRIGLNTTEQRIKEENKNIEEVIAKWNIEKIYCQPCKKTFKSQSQYKNHISSKKHKQTLTSLNLPIKTEIAHIEDEIPSLINDDCKHKIEETVNTAISSVDTKVISHDDIILKEKIDKKNTKAAEKRKEKKEKRKAKRSNLIDKSCEQKNICNTCMEQFSSRSKLFIHIEQQGHATIKLHK